MPEPAEKPSLQCLHSKLDCHREYNTVFTGGAIPSPFTGIITALVLEQLALHGSSLRWCIGVCYVFGKMLDVVMS